MPYDSASVYQRPRQRCSVCDRLKRKDDFSRLGWRSAICRPCELEQQRPGNAQYAHVRRLARDYGLTVAQYEQMLAKQEGKCAICGELPKTGRRLYVDHDHTTGLVRGLLCNRCNAGIGLMQESLDLLQRAIRYLSAPLEQ